MERSDFFVDRRLTGQQPCASSRTPWGFFVWVLEVGFLFWSGTLTGAKHDGIWGSVKQTVTSLTRTGD